MINTRAAQKFCKDDISKIENYELALADPTHTWDLHHRLELTLDGEFAHSREELKRLGMYYHRPYFELIFLTHSEHQRLHKKGKNHHLYGKYHSAATRKQMSAAQKGKHHSEESRKKISEAMKGRKCKPFTAEHLRKLSEAAKRSWARRRAANT